MSRSTGGRKLVVVTGASSGIGRGVARALAARGDAVVLVSRSHQVLREVARQCQAAGGRALVVRTDVSDEGVVQRVVVRAVDELGVSTRGSTQPLARATEDSGAITASPKIAMWMTVLLQT